MLKWTGCFAMLFFFLKAQAQQKLLTEVTVTYRIEAADSLQPLPALFQDAYEQLTVKGRKARTDLVTKNYRQTIIADNISGTAKVAKEIGSGKYLYDLDADEWKQYNQIYDSVSVQISDEHRTILDYDCVKTIIQLENGRKLIFYCSPQLTTAASVIPRLYTLLPGLPLAYEIYDSNFRQSFRFVATDINAGIVPGGSMELQGGDYRKMN